MHTWEPATRLLDIFQVGSAISRIKLACWVVDKQVLTALEPSR